MLMKNIAVILLNLGGPTSLETIRPFLYNLFRDPDIFKIPIGQQLFAKIISKFRAPKVREQYEKLGGNSPINKWTEIQRMKLESSLQSSLKEKSQINVFTAMRYWKPLTEETIECLNKKEYFKIILLPLYPHYSIVTTGSSFNEWKRKYNGNWSKLVYIDEYHDFPPYLEALNEKINEGLLKFDEAIRNDVQLVFSAHGTPVSVIEGGDPYKNQIENTVDSIMKLRNYSHNHHLCFQSRVGPIKWLEPYTDDMIKKLASEGKKHLLVIPVSFVSDHVETLFELNEEYREVADEVGIENYIVTEGLNDSNMFVSALEKLVLNELNKIDLN